MNPITTVNQSTGGATYP